LTAASLLNEKYTGNVDQLINLGDLYCELERPRDALAAIGSMVAPTSPLGAMQLESVRLEAAEQLRDTQQVTRSLDYVRTHRADAPSTYVDSLIVVNQLDQAARVLIAQLLDMDQRQAALLSVQGFAPVPGTPRDMTLAARRRAVIARPDVQLAIDKVGRVDSYRVEAPY
jgi:beta-barrel assembly-enhancing protease